MHVHTHDASDQSTWPLRERERERGNDPGTNMCLSPASHTQMFTMEEAQEPLFQSLGTDGHYVPNVFRLLLSRSRSIRKAASRTDCTREQLVPTHPFVLADEMIQGDSSRI